MRPAFFRMLPQDSPTVSGTGWARNWASARENCTRAAPWALKDSPPTNINFSAKAKPSPATARAIALSSIVLFSRLRKKSCGFHSERSEEPLLLPIKSLREILRASPALRMTVFRFFQQLAGAKRLENMNSLESSAHLRRDKGKLP